MSPLQCICIRRLAGLPCTCIRLSHLPSPDCDCPTCSDTARSFAGRFICLIGRCREVFTSAAAANRHCERDHIHLYQLDCPCRVCARKAKYFFGSYYRLHGHRHRDDYPTSEARRQIRRADV
jgi:hypothetical protein